MARRVPAKRSARAVRASSIRPARLRGPVVVTGAGGFVGANLCRFLRDRGVSVVGVEGPSLTSWRLAGVSDIKLVRTDLCDAAAVDSLIKDVKPAAILHCAAYGAYSQQTDVARIYRVNVDATRYLLESAASLAQRPVFVQAGSSSEYGLNCTRPSEDAPTWPDSHYSVSKIAAAAMVRFYAVKHQLPGFVLRLYSVYGPLEDSTRLIPKLLAAAAEGKLPPLVNPDISRDFVFTEDVCEAFLRVVQRAPKLEAGEIFNVAAGKKVTLRQLVAVARKQFGIRAKPDFGSMPSRHWDHADWFGNPRKAAQKLGWRAGTSLGEGLQKTAAWMAGNPDLISAAATFRVV